MTAKQSDNMPFNPQGMDSVELHPAICGLIWSLPWWDNAKWEQTRDWNANDRDAWIKAFIAVTDMICILDKPRPKSEITVAVEKKETTKETVTTTVMMKGAPEVPVFPAPPPPDVPILIDAPNNERFVEAAPYRGSKRAASIVWEIIQKGAKRASVWLNSSGRVRVGSPDRTGDNGEQLVGVYEPTTPKSHIAEDLKAAGPNGS